MADINISDTPTFSQMQNNLTGDATAGDGWCELEIPYSENYWWGGRSKAAMEATEPKKQPATIELIRRSPAMMYVANTTTGALEAMTNKFYLTAVQEERGEKAQLMETFGSSVAFFYGEKQKIYSFSGHLLETKSSVPKFEHKYLWTSSLLKLWDEKLRATKLAEAGSRAVLTFQNNSIYGYPLNLSIMRGADQPTSTQFSFSMLVTNHKLMENNNIDDMYTVPETIDSLQARQRRSQLFFKEQQIIQAMEKIIDDMSPIPWAQISDATVQEYYSLKEDLKAVKDEIAELTTNVINPDIANARAWKELDG